MSVGHAFLGLLELGPRHGYELKRAYDEQFGKDRPVRFGQVYATLARLLKSELVIINSVEPGGGPDRKSYAVTDAGVTDVDKWLHLPETPDMYLQSTLYMKVVLALMLGKSAVDVLDVQRRAHSKAMRELTRRKASGDLADQLTCDYALMHLDADLRWLELTAARMADLATKVGR
jgi:DNA-binding PadR family transcriptional regulator